MKLEANIFGENVQKMKNGNYLGSLPKMEQVLAISLNSMNIGSYSKTI